MKETDAILLFKCLADRSRLALLKSLLREENHVERLAMELDLSEGTVSYHLKRMERAGMVSARREQYYTVYSIRPELLALSMADVLSAPPEGSGARAPGEDAWRSKVLASFFLGDRLKSIPVQRKKKQVILAHIVQAFSPDKPYPEKEVNEILSRFHEDYCTLRRDLVSEGLLARREGIYTRMK